MKPISTMLGLFIVALMPLVALAEPTLRVEDSTLRINGQASKKAEYTGSCPVSLVFTWNVSASEPTDIRYSFVRSDAGHTFSTTMHANAGVKTNSLINEWDLGENDEAYTNYQGWVELNVESPAMMTKRIPFTLHCKA